MTGYRELEYTNIPAWCVAIVSVTASSAINNVCLVKYADKSHCCPRDCKLKDENFRTV